MEGGEERSGSPKNEPETNKSNEGEIDNRQFAPEFSEARRAYLDTKTDTETESPPETPTEAVDQTFRQYFKQHLKNLGGGYTGFFGSIYLINTFYNTAEKFYFNWRTGDTYITAEEGLVTITSAAVGVALSVVLEARARYHSDKQKSQQQENTS